MEIIGAKDVRLKLIALNIIKVKQKDSAIYNNIFSEKLDKYQSTSFYSF